MDLKVIKKSSLQDMLLRLVFALAVMVAVFWLIRAGLTLIEPSRAYKVEGNLPTATRASATTPLEATQFDSDFDPFHRARGAEAKAPMVALIGEDAPETDLNLKLKGLRASGDGTGSAVLKLPDGTEETFVQGADILRNVTLEAIYSTHIIISRNAVHERVTFERNGGSLVQSAGADADILLETQAERPSPQEETVVVKDDVKAKFADLTSEDLIRKLRFSPVREGRNVKGYRLQVRDRSFDLSEVGYQSGDLVTHINSQDLRQGRPEFEAIFKQIEQNPDGTILTIDRNGDILNLNLN